jgi:hypothetical protein
MRSIEHAFEIVSCPPPEAGAAVRCTGAPQQCRLEEAAMSTVVAFTPVRARRAQRPVAEVVPIEAARAARNRQSAARAGMVAGPQGSLASGRPAPAPLRLTRRGQVVAGALLVVVLAAVIAAGILLIGHQALAGEQARPVPASYHVVLPGETLWTIAATAAPAADRRDTVNRIEEFNALDSAAIQVGQRIALPGDLASH